MAVPQTSSSSSAAAIAGPRRHNDSSLPKRRKHSDDLLHFFVSMTPRSLAIHARPCDTVSSVMDQIKALTGIPTPDQRLIYLGRELPGDHTLAQCAVQRDACLHLTGRLRSTNFPHAWRMVADLVDAIRFLCTTAADNTARPRKEKLLLWLLPEFLQIARDKEKSRYSKLGGYNNKTWAQGYLHIFLVACVPRALVTLYNSSVGNNARLGESSIRLLLNTDELKHCSAPAVLELCKLLAETAGKKDLVYIACQSSFAALLAAEDSSLDHLSANDRITELLPFVTDLGRGLIEKLPFIVVFPDDLAEFSNFLLAIRRAIRGCMGGACIPRQLYNDNTGYVDWMGSLHTLFTTFLEKANFCLGNIGVLLAHKSTVESETSWTTWAHLLLVLTMLNRFSKIFEGGGDLLHEVLLFRRFPLNTLIERAKRSSERSLRWLLKHKDVTSFEARRNLVLMMLPDGKDDYAEMHEMLIDRSQLLSESFEYIGQAKANELHGGLFMEFKNEEATGPGVLREWFCLLCRAIFNPQNVLFVACPNDQRRFFPNPASVVDPLHLKYFGFCGRVIALALMHKVQVGIVFDRVFFLQLAGQNVSLEDVQDADPCLYMSCKKILDMEAELLDSDVLGLTFTREIEELGSRKAMELCPGGKDIAVNSKNRVEYVNLLIQHRFVTSISEQVSYFTRGFGDLLISAKHNKFLFQSLYLEDFDQMLGGSDTVINASEWKEHTEYNGYTAKDRQICWFWKIVEGMSAEQRRVLLFFWTSVKYLPVDGFGGLASKLYIYKALDSHDHLPTSNTCFYRLNLPPYRSVSIMRDRLQLITQEHVSCTFGNW